MRASGKVNVIGLLLTVAAIGAIYWAVIFAPIYVDNFEAQDAVNAGFNKWGVGEVNINEEGTRATIRAKLRDSKFGTHMEIDPASGEEKEMPGLNVPEENLTVTWDEPSSVLSIHLEYDREVQLKPFDKKRIVHFVIDRTGKPGERK